METVTVNADNKRMLGMRLEVFMRLRSVAFPVGLLFRIGMRTEVGNGLRKASALFELRG